MAPLLGLYLSKYLKFEGVQIAWIFNAFAIASLTGMFFGSQLADRYFAQERFLSFSHLVGGLSMLGLAYTKQFWPFFGLMLLHCFFYVPTLSVTNAIAFANLKDAQKDFGPIRVWGRSAGSRRAGRSSSSRSTGPRCRAWPRPGASSPGWARHSLPPRPVTRWNCGADEHLLRLGDRVARAGRLLLDPAAHPAVQGAGSEVRTARGPQAAWPSRASCVLFVVTLLDSFIHYCYFFWTSPFFSAIGLPENWIAPAMSIGQIAEITTMAYLGFFLKRLGWRTTMILGILGHVVRFSIYAIGVSGHALAGHPQQRGPRLRLRLLLRHGLHLRG